MTQEKSLPESSDRSNNPFCVAFSQLGLRSLVWVLSIAGLLGWAVVAQAQTAKTNVATGAFQSFTDPPFSAPVFAARDAHDATASVIGAKSSGSFSVMFSGEALSLTGRACPNNLTTDAAYASLEAPAAPMGAQMVTQAGFINLVHNADVNRFSQAVENSALTIFSSVMDLKISIRT